MRIHCFVVAALACGWLGDVRAAEGQVEWSIKGYACPGDALEGGFVVESKGRLSLPGQPAEAGGDEVLRTFIRQSSAVLREYLKTQGVDLPDGSLVVLDRERHTLAARTTAEGHKGLEEVVRDWVSRLSHAAAFQVQVVTAPADGMRRLLGEAAGTSEHGGLLDRLEQEAAEGRASVVGTARIETRSGQRAIVQMATEREFVTEFAARVDGPSEGVTRETKEVGLRVELEPVIGSDNETMDVTFSIRQSLGEPTSRWAPLGTLAGRRVEGEVTDFHEALCSTATTLLSGQTRLLGAWPAGGGNVQAGFVTAHCPALLMIKDDRAEIWLRTHGDAVQPVPERVEKTDEDLGIPAGMILRRFRVPPDLLAMGGRGEEAAGDPFSAPEPVFTVQMTAQDILVAAGIPFPPGSSAVFNRARGELLVRNTPGNMALVEEFMSDAIIEPSRMKLLQFRLHVVEADSALVRRLGRESLALTDHRAAWETLQAEVAEGRGRVVETAMLETRSGQRSMVRAGTEYAQLIPDTYGQPPKPENATVVVAAAGTPNTEITATSDSKLLGLEWEIESVVGANGKVDVTTAVSRQSRPPTERFEAPRDGLTTRRIDAPGVDFHSLNLKTSFVTVDGMKRLTGIWQPVTGEGTLSKDRLHAVFLEVRVVTPTEGGG